MRSLLWTLATTAGFVAGGVALHSPGASGIGATYFEWDVSAAVFGAVLGAVVGAVAGLLQLLALGIRDYRETFFKPYRIVYTVEGKRVYVSLIADGRRDMQTLLARRLLGA